MARWFVNNLGLFFLAILIAGAAWTLASIQDDPILEETIAVRVTRLNEPAPADFMITDRLPNSVAVRARGPRSVLLVLAANPPVITIDVGRLGDGNHVIPLTTTFGAASAQILSSSPATGTLRLDRVARASLPVRLSLSGAPSLGFRTGPPTVSPAQASISGSQAAVQRVVTLDAQVSVEGAKSAVQADARIIARDANGEPVADVQIAPEVVSVRAPLEQLSNYRDLPVTPKWRGQPAEGYAVTAITVEPQIVTVFGDSTVIQAAKGFIETQDVVISNAQADIDERVNLIVPPGLSLVSERASVRVRVRIQPLLGSRTIKRKPLLIGLSSTLTNTISPDSVDLVLSGPLPRLGTLIDDDVRVTLDVTGLDIGTYQLTPRVILPEGLTAQTVLPTTVRVELATRKK
jgi:YbbR domain-containing protein